MKKYHVSSKIIHLEANKEHKNNRNITKIVREDETFANSEKNIANKFNKYIATIGQKLTEQEINEQKKITNYSNNESCTILCIRADKRRRNTLNCFPLKKKQQKSYNKINKYQYRLQRN